MRIEERVIVKYNPKYYDAKGVYTKDEWTDFSDIGKEFEGKRLSLEEYLEEENNFIAFVKECLELAECHYLTTNWSWENDQKYFKKSIKSICKLDPNFDESECLTLVQEIDAKKRISTSIAMYLFKLMLRYAFNASLSNRKRKIKFYMGYEYYLHFFTSIDRETLKKIASKYNLYVVW